MTMRDSRSGFVAAALTAAGVMVSLGGCAVRAEDGADDVRGEREVVTTSEAALVGSDAPADTSERDYSFVIATRTWRGFEVSSLNGAPLPCGDGRAYARRAGDTCSVASIDLSPAEIGKDDAAALLREIGSDPRSATLVLVGKVTRTERACGTTEARFRAWEVWRAPEPVRLHGEWLHVSHEASQALRVNAWDVSRVRKIDFGRSPKMEYCRLVDGEETCDVSHEGVMKDAVAPAGLLVDGFRDGRGVVHVNQYFLKIIVGQARLPNGFWLCSAEQFACDDGDCVPAPEVCNAHTGHGRGLLTYARTFDAVVQPWLVLTTQLKPTEIVLHP
jgi:hypothetical protein